MKNLAEPAKPPSRDGNSAKDRRKPKLNRNTGYRKHQPESRSVLSSCAAVMYSISWIMDTRVASNNVENSLLFFFFYVSTPGPNNDDTWTQIDGTPGPTVRRTYDDVSRPRQSRGRSTVRHRNGKRASTVGGTAHASNAPRGVA